MVLGGKVEDVVGVIMVEVEEVGCGRGNGNGIRRQYGECLLLVGEMGAAVVLTMVIGVRSTEWSSD